MEKPAPRTHELRVDGSADPLVNKIEADGHLVEDLPADELFHAGGGRFVAGADPDGLRCDPIPEEHVAPAARCWARSRANQPRASSCKRSRSPSSHSSNGAS